MARVYNQRYKHRNQRRIYKRGAVRTWRRLLVSLVRSERFDDIPPDRIRPRNPVENNYSDHYWRDKGVWWWRDGGALFSELTTTFMYDTVRPSS